MPDSRIVSFLKRLLINGELNVDLRKDALELLLTQPANVIEKEVEFTTREGKFVVREGTLDVVKYAYQTEGKVFAIKTIREKLCCSLAVGVDICNELFPKPPVLIDGSDAQPLMDKEPKKQGAKKKVNK